MAPRFRLLDDATGGWASFAPLTGAWSDERMSPATGGGGPGSTLSATARPTGAGAVEAPSGLRRSGLARRDQVSLRRLA